jgi:phosphotransferase system enzyme I (PtsP)
MPVVKGVGLFRTEILFMTTDGVMDLATQVREYKEILDKAAEKQVVFRTIDMTDDKEAAFFEEQFNKKYMPEAPKAPLKESLQYSKHLPLATQMGKILFYRHSFLKTQVQALLQARIQSERPHDPINIMIPMISDTVELKAYQKIIEAETRYLSAQHPSIASQVKLGVMVEVPALVYQLDKICNLVDFVSIGTNDLFQFFFAANRWDASGLVSQDVLSPTFLYFIGNIISQLQQLAITMHVCGEMATNPLTAMVLLALGIRKLSVSPNAVGRIAKMVNTLPLNSLRNYMQTFSTSQYELNISTKNQYKSSTDVRNTLQNFIRDNGVEV